MYEARILAFAGTVNQHHIILNSGGMDSLLVHDLIHRNKAPAHSAVSVLCDYSQKYWHKEWGAATLIAKHYGVRFVVAPCAPIARFEHESGIVPFRNAELLLQAAQQGQRERLNVLYMGVLAYEVNSDKSPAFLRHMKKVLNISHRPQYWSDGKRYKIMTPLKKLTKTEAVSRYLETGGDVEMLLRTVSCYSAGDRHCGRCASCFKRWVALVNNGLFQEFVEDPRDYYAPDQLQAKLKGYARGRKREILQALEGS